MPTKRRAPLDRKCKNSERTIPVSELTGIDGEKNNFPLVVADKSTTVLTSAENTVGLEKNLVKEKRHSPPITEDENDSGLCASARKRKAAVSLDKESHEKLHQISDDESEHTKKPRVSPPKQAKYAAPSITDDFDSPNAHACDSVNRPNCSTSTSASEPIIISPDEQRLRSELPAFVIEYAKKLEVCDLKDFKRQIQEAIWKHFYDENSAFEQVSSNRPIPGFELRSQQIKQAQGALSQLFGQIRTPTQISLFVRDYSSVLKFNSLQRFNASLLSLISAHQKRERPSFFNRFCTIQ